MGNALYSSLNRQDYIRMHLASIQSNGPVLTCPKCSNVVHFNRDGTLPHGLLNFKCRHCSGKISETNFLSLLKSCGYPFIDGINTAKSKVASNAAPEIDFTTNALPSGTLSSNFPLKETQKIDRYLTKQPVKETKQPVAASSYDTKLSQMEQIIVAMKEDHDLAIATLKNEHDISIKEIRNDMESQFLMMRNDLANVVAELKNCCLRLQESKPDTQISQQQNEKQQSYAQKARTVPTGKKPSLQKGVSLSKGQTILHNITKNRSHRTTTGPSTKVKLAPRVPPEQIIPMEKWTALSFRNVQWAKISEIKHCFRKLNLDTSKFVNICWGRGRILNITLDAEIADEFTEFVAEELKWKKIHVDELLHQKEKAQSKLFAARAINQTIFHFFCSQRSKHVSSLAVETFIKGNSIKLAKEVLDWDTELLESIWEDTEKYFAKIRQSASDVEATSQQTEQEGPSQSTQ